MACLQNRGKIPAPRARCMACGNGLPRACAFAHRRASLSGCSADN